MAEVVALYRFPVKGFTEEPRSELTVLDDGRIYGDRALTFRYANALEPRMRGGNEVWSKSKGLSRMDYPSLAALRLTLDDVANFRGDAASVGRIRIDAPDGMLVDADLTATGRERIASAVTAYLLNSPDAPLLEAPGRTPLHLIGELGQARFHDSMLGYVAMHSRESLRALEGALESPLEDHRFRSNIVIEGVEAWQEISELSRVRIGGVEFAPQEPIVRCLNTHANPKTGVRDAQVLPTLTRAFGHSQPTFGRYLLPVGGGGTIHVGDTVELID